jgi:glycosyltransferase involved in cell wall biosynthesis
VRVLVIVPAYNEAMNIASVIRSLRRDGPECDVAVVDDGSSDGTAAIARSQGARVIQSAMNLGIGGAVQTGYLWAREHGYDAAVQIDGDGQHDPRFIASALAPIELGKADLVVGSRFIEGVGFRSTVLRRIGIRYLAWFLRLRCGARVTDPTSGFRAAGRRAVALFAEQYPSDYPEPESIAVAVRAGLRVHEVPVRMRNREHGRSSINAIRTLYYLMKVSIALLLLPARIRSTAVDGGDSAS